MRGGGVGGELETLEGVAVVLATEGVAEEVDYFVDVGVLLLEFLVMAAALEGVAGADEAGHFLVEAVGPA